MIGSIDKLLILVIIKKKPIILPIETRCKLDFNLRLKSTYIQVKLSEVPKKRIPKLLIVGICMIELPKKYKSSIIKIIGNRLSFIVET
jgi:hypothetical protein